MAGRVGGDDRGRLGHAVALEHRNADGAEISLKLDVQKRAAAHEELHPAAESLSDFLEYDLVEQGHQRLLPQLEETAAVVVLLVVGDREVEGVVVELLDLRPLLVDRGLDVLLEVARQSGNRQHHVRTDLLDRYRNIPERRQRIGSDRNCGDAAAVGHHRVEAGHVGEAVVQRQDDKHRGVGFHSDHRMSLLHVRRVVAVGQKNTLRVGCGAGSVADRGVVIRLYGFVAFLELGLVAEQVAVAEGLYPFHRDLLGVCRRDIVQHDDLLHAVQLGDYPADLRELLAGNDHEPGLGMLDPESQVVAFLKLDGERDAHAAGVEDSQLGKDPHVPSL